MNFKVGDRIVAYSAIYGKKHGTILHTAVALVGKDNTAFLSFKDEEGKENVAHPKQCRKLVKKEKIELNVKFERREGFVFPICTDQLFEWVDLNNRKFKMTLQEIK